MTQYERMQKGLIFYTCDPEVQKIQQQYQQKLFEFNQLSPIQIEEKKARFKELFAECGENNWIEGPIRATWGCSHVHLGNRIYANINLTLVDDGHIYIADRVLIGPNVTIATANHPLEPTLRRYEMEYVRDVHIGENTWIGSGAIILPGVSIGKNCVIGAGSIVTRDIPDNSLAYGNPCHIAREIGEYDKEYYYKTDRIDWENLQEQVDKKREKWGEK